MRTFFVLFVIAACYNVAQINAPTGARTLSERGQFTKAEWSEPTCRSIPRSSLTQPTKRERPQGFALPAGDARVGASCSAFLAHRNINSASSLYSKHGGNPVFASIVDYNPVYPMFSPARGVLIVGMTPSESSEIRDAQTGSRRQRANILNTGPGAAFATSVASILLVRAGRHVRIARYGGGRCEARGKQRGLPPACALLADSAHCWPDIERAKSAVKGLPMSLLSRGKPGRLVGYVQHADSKDRHQGYCSASVAQDLSENSISLYAKKSLTLWGGNAPAAVRRPFSFFQLITSTAVARKIASTMPSPLFSGGSGRWATHLTTKSFAITATKRLATTVLVLINGRRAR